MSEDNKPSILFWVAGIAFLLWNIVGCYLYYMDQTMSEVAYTEAYGEALASVREMYPVWAVSAYAIAVWGGLLAAIMFLLKKKWAAPLFILSLICAIISFIWGFITPEFKAAAGSSHWVMPLIVCTLGLVEVLVSRRFAANNVLR